MGGLSKRDQGVKRQVKRLQSRLKGERDAITRATNEKILGPTLWHEWARNEGTRGEVLHKGGGEYDGNARVGSVRRRLRGTRFKSSVDRWDLGPDWEAERFKAEPGD